MASLRLLNTFRNISTNNKTSFLKLTNVYFQQNFVSSKTEIFSQNNDTEKKKKTIPIPKITLISPDESVQIVSFDEAQKISKRRDLKLVKIIDLDTKTQRPVYKLMTGASYFAEDLKQRELKKEKKQENSIKGEKLLLINSRISEHDLESRIKNILKWVNKKYEIRVVISGDSSNLDSCEKVYDIIEKNLKSDCRIQQKRTKGNELKFQIRPQKNSKQKSAETL